ncbi:MAG TPA: efflux RND transporter periplasmic adaptor subunit [bacterium]|nr:efflux RND transporter periplasmic adaptor subunit [bacterium]
MEQSHSAPEIKELLGIDQVTRRHQRLKRWIGGGGVLLLAVAAVLAWRLTSRSDAPQYKTEAATKADLVVQVTATGSLEPITQVDVGSELSGIIRTLSVDYNDRVKAGQVMARLDSAKQEAQVQQSMAALEAAQAQVLNAKATVEQTHLQLQRLRELAPTQSVSAHDLQAAEADYKRALAVLAVNQADVDKAKANLNADQITLSKMAIRAPIDGIVLRRNVEVGQTVAASLQAPVLFTLADNLRKMQISVAVDEADVGKVQKGQSAVFTVDAYPDRSFSATVTEVRYAPQTVAGVVTYEALLGVDNSDLLLRPGMTATANITVSRHDDALLVPNAALRFTPPQSAQNNGGSSWLRSLMGRRQHSSPQPAAAEAKGAQRVVWTLRDNRPVAIPVTVGQTDGRVTQVVQGELKPGTRLLVDLLQAKP